MDKKRFVYKYALLTERSIYAAWDVNYGLGLIIR